MPKPVPIRATSFPYLPQRSGYNKRPPKAAGLMRSVNRTLAANSVWSEDVWVADLRPGVVRAAAQRESASES